MVGQPPTLPAIWFCVHISCRWKKVVDFPRSDMVPVFPETPGRRRAGQPVRPAVNALCTTPPGPSEKVKVLPRYVESRPADVQNLIQ
jgi:hypothetical protein